MGRRSTSSGGGRRPARQGRAGGLFYRTVAFTSIITVVPIIFFISRILPEQQAIVMSNLEQQVRSLAASIDETSVASIVAEDYTPVVEQCQKVLAQSPYLEYVVVTRKESGFSIINRRDGWRQATLGGFWIALDPEEESRLISRRHPWEEGEILHYSYPIRHANWTWGWIHVGLAPEQFRTQFMAVRRKILNVALLSILIDVGGAFYFSSRLTRPIRTLNDSIQSLAAGNLEARAHIRSGDEVQRLAEAFNSMAQSLAQSQRALTAAKNYNENIIRSSIGMMIVLDPEGHVTFMNRSALELLGYSEEEIRGEPLGRIMVAPTGGEPAAETVATLAAGGVIHGAEHTFRDRSGRDILVLFSGCAMETDGRITALVCSALDITERKRAEMEVEQLHRKLMDASRHAGMAEVANNVLHNVGNVLNSVNVTTAFLIERAGEPRTRALRRLVALLKSREGDLADFLTNDEQGRNVLPYLESIAAHFDEEQRVFVEELRSLGGRIDHIKEVVAMQQDYSKLYGLRENLQLDALVEDAIRMNVAALTRHAVRIERDYRTTPEVNTDRHKVLQILVNLIRNAKYAMDEREDERLLRIVIEERDGMASVSVIDNGIGMSEEVRARLFEHGFTTRRSGHGYGLHGSHLAACEIGGTLTGHSDGPGLGATFTLTIPLGTGHNNDV